MPEGKANAEGAPKDPSADFRGLLEAIFTQSGKKGDSEWLEGIDVGDGKTAEISLPFELPAPIANLFTKKLNEITGLSVTLKKLEKAPSKAAQSVL